MRRCVGGLLLLCLLGLCDPVRAQGTKDVIELLPARTLACLEVRHPERLAREIAALTKGSALEDLPSRLARFRASLPGGARFWMPEEVGLFGLMFSPEMLAEGGRVGGAAVAVTGIAKDGTPEVVGLIQHGDSNLVGLYARGFLSFSNAQHIADVEGVPLYREKHQVFRKAVKGGAPQPPPEVEETGPVLAQLPGLTIIGSSPESVKDVIRRAKGKVAEPALNEAAAYRKAGALRDRPGLFAHADLDALFAQVEEALKRGNEPAARRDLDEWLLGKALLNPAALRGLTVSLSLVNGTLELRGQLQLDPRQKCPLLDLMSEQGVKLNWLQPAPQDSALALGVSLGDGQKFWEQVLALADDVGRAAGAAAEDLPSKELAKFEELLKLKLGKDVAGKLRGAALILPPAGGKDPLGVGEPVLALQAVNAEVARFLEETALPRLARDFKGGEKAELQRVEVEGQTLIQLPGGGIFQGMGIPGPIYAGRRGGLLVMGQFKEGVAQALAVGIKKEALTAQEKVAAALKEADESALLGVGHLGPLALMGIRNAGVAVQGNEVVGVTLPPKAVEAYGKAMATLPPLLLTVQRKPEQLTLVLRQSALRPAAPRLLDLWVEMVLERWRIRMQEQPRFGGKN